jgi:hypothetical protein
VTRAYVPRQVRAAEVLRLPKGERLRAGVVTAAFDGIVV